MVNLELHRIKTGEKKFRRKSKGTRNEKPLRSFRNSRGDRRPQYSRNDRKRESASVSCADCGTECRVPFIPKTDRPVYCSDCFRKNKIPDSEDRRYFKKDRDSKFSKARDYRSSPDEKTSKPNKFLKKQESLYSGGSEKFYNTLKEKLFEILGGKVCSNCGFRDERALGFSHIYGEDTFDSIRRGGFASSWGKYISDPELAREELKILCLNCNEIKKPIEKPEKKSKEFKKKKKRFPR